MRYGGQEAIYRPAKKFHGPHGISKQFKKYSPKRIIKDPHCRPDPHPPPLFSDFVITIFSERPHLAYPGTPTP